MKHILFMTFLFFTLQINLVCSQTKFNMFKSYKNAKVRPKQYSQRSRPHSIEEYLSPSQMKMLRERSGPDKSENMFDANWSGYHKNNGGGSMRRLAGVEMQYVYSHISEYDSLYAIVSFLAIIVFIITALLARKVLSRRIFGTKGKVKEVPEAEV